MDYCVKSRTGAVIGRVLLVCIGILTVACTTGLSELSQEQVLQGWQKGSSKYQSVQMTGAYFQEDDEGVTTNYFNLWLEGNNVKSYIYTRISDPTYCGETYYRSPGINYNVCNGGMIHTTMADVFTRQFQILRFFVIGYDDSNDCIRTNIASAYMDSAFTATNGLTVSTAQVDTNKYEVNVTKGNNDIIWRLNTSKEFNPEYFEIKHVGQITQVIETVTFDLTNSPDFGWHICGGVRSRFDDVSESLEVAERMTCKVSYLESIHRDTLVFDIDKQNPNGYLVDRSLDMGNPTITKISDLQATSNTNSVQ